MGTFGFLTSICKNAILVPLGITRVSHQRTQWLSSSAPHTSPSHWVSELKTTYHPKTQKVLQWSGTIHLVGKKPSSRVQVATALEYCYLIKPVT